MSKKIPTKDIISDITMRGVITEREISLIKSRYNHNKDGELKEMGNKPFTDPSNPIWVTDEQAHKGLEYLRNHLLTKAHKKRVNCNWDDYQLTAIGYQGEGRPYKSYDYIQLFRFLGFVNIGTDSFPCNSPIYQIHGTAYYMKQGEPVILYG